VVSLFDSAGNLLATRQVGPSAGDDCCGVPAPLKPGFIGSAYFGFETANIILTAGQQWRFKLTPGYGAAGVAGAAADSYAGGTMYLGDVPQPGRDLAFKVHVR